MIPIFVTDDRPSGKNAVATIFWIKIWRGVPCFGAVLQHERDHIKTFWMIILGMAPFAVAAGFFVHWLAAVGLGLLSMSAMAVPALNRWREIRGHAIECAVAERYYGADLTLYEMSEASAMVGKGAFKEVDVLAVDEMLRSKRQWAKRQVAGRTKQIQKDMKRVQP